MTNKNLLHNILIRMKKISALILFFFIFLILSPKIVFSEALFHDDFENGSLSQWSVLRGNWTIHELSGNKWVGGYSPSFADSEMQAGSYSWSDYEFSFDMLPISGVNRNVFFRVNAERSHGLPNHDLPVAYGLHLTTGLLELQKWTAQNGQLLSSQSIGFPSNIISKVKVSIQGTDIKIFINSSTTPAIHYVDTTSPILKGRIALAIIAGNDSSEVWYDNVLVNNLATSTLPLIVIAPGLGASWNPEAILGCNLNAGGEWTLASYAEQFYLPILTALQNEGIEYKLFTYDWRKNVTESGSDLNDFLGVNLSSGQFANVVGHSLGGLVGRAYLEGQQENHRLNKLLTVGSPHKGAALAYYPWESGDIKTDSFLTKIAINILIKHCGGLFKTNREVIQKISPSIGNLLPVDSYLRDWKTGEIKPIIEMKEKNTWIHSSALVSPFFGVNFGTLSGKGNQTLETIEVKPRNKFEELLKNWFDGKPMKEEISAEGDGTVLTASSNYDDTKNTVINQTHGGLIASSEGISEIFNFLEIPSLALTNKFTEPKSALIIIGYPSSFWVVNQDGKITNDKNGMVSLINPKANQYKFELQPKNDKTLLIVGQFLEDGRVFWKEYNLKNISRKSGLINFNPTNPQEDPLKLNP